MANIKKNLRKAHLQTVFESFVCARHCAGKQYEEEQS